MTRMLSDDLIIEAGWWREKCILLRGSRLW